MATNPLRNVNLFESNGFIQFIPPIVAFSVLIWLRNSIAQSKLPPGPPTKTWLQWLLLGNDVPAKYPWRWFETVTAQYGPVFTIHLGRHPTFVVGSYAAAIEILEKQSSLTSDRPTSIMSGETMSGGKRVLLVKYGDRWRRLRKMLHQGLQTKMAISYEPIQERAAHRFMLDILESPDEFANHAKSYAASVILSITYGKTTQTRYSDDDVMAVNACLERLGRSLSPGKYLVDKFPGLRYLPFDIQNWRSDGTRWHQEELALFSKQLNGVREDIKSGKGVDCFARYIIEHQVEYQLSNDEAAYLAGSMFGAGSDTTAAYLSIAIMVLATETLANKAVQAELDSVVGRSRLPTFNDQKDLPLLNAFIKEVHRFRPVSSGGFAHSSTADITYRDRVIPAGSSIIGNHWSISRDPLVFDEPEVFSLSRWFVDDDMDALVPREDLEHVGYGFGRRVCAGKNVADRSIFINCALLIWSFDIMRKKDEAGFDIEIDTMAFTNSSNSHPLPYSVAFRPKTGVQDILGAVDL